MKAGSKSAVETGGDAAGYRESPVDFHAIVIAGCGLWAEMETARDQKERTLATFYIQQYYTNKRAGISPFLSPSEGSTYVE